MIRLRRTVFGGAKRLSGCWRLEWHAALLHRDEQADG